MRNYEGNLVGHNWLTDNEEERGSTQNDGIYVERSPVGKYVIENGYARAELNDGRVDVKAKRKLRGWVCEQHELGVEWPRITAGIIKLFS